MVENESAQCVRPSRLLSNPVTYAWVYVTIFRKIDHLCTSTEIPFLPVRESYIHALSRQVLDHKWPSLLLQTALCRCC